MDRRIVLVLFIVVMLGLAAGVYVAVTRAPSSGDRGDTATGADAGDELLRPGDLERDAAADRVRPGARGSRDAVPQAQGDTVATDGMRLPTVPVPAKQGAEEDAGTAANPYPTSPDGIRAAVRDRKPELVECYEGWQALNPAIEGTLVVSFGINTGENELAHVDDVALASSDLEHEVMRGCVLDVFEELAFEPPEGGAMTLTHHLEFSADPDED